MKKFDFCLSAALIFVLFLAACATPPAEEMERAADAVSRAENDADAVNYAGNTLLRARDALGRMQDEADARRYDSASNYASEAVALAERAVEEGRAGAARARDQAEALIADLHDPLAETSQIVDAARRDGSLDLDSDALSGELESAFQSRDQAQRNFDDENYQDAIASGQDARSAISGINAKVTGAAGASRKK